MRNACIAFFLLLAACGGERVPPPPADSTIPPSQPVIPDAPSRAPSGWDERAGPVLLVAGEQPDEVFVVYPEQPEDESDAPEVAEYSGSEATLIGRHGVTGTAILTTAPARTEEAGCSPWPRIAAPGVATPWTVGFVRAAIDAVPGESLGALASRDSLRFVADVARLASTLAGTRRGEHAVSFQGLPFVVKDAARFPTNGGHTAVAHVVRRVNQEANPLEEHTLLILERRDAADRWSIAYSQHSAGHEETVMREELLGVVRLGGRLTLVLALDDGEGVAYALVQRVGDRRWRQVWQSARASC